MKNKKQFPKWVMDFRIYCAEHQLTVADVSEHTGIAQSTIGCYRTGKKRPGLKNSKRIKDGIGFDMYQALYLSYQEEEKKKCQKQG